jgi:hypothetical protein
MKHKHDLSERLNTLKSAIRDKNQALKQHQQPFGYNFLQDSTAKRLEAMRVMIILFYGDRVFNLTLT